MEIRVGRVTHYFSRIGVAGVHMEADELQVGDIIRIKGHTTDFMQPVESIQLEHESIEQAKTGMDIGLKVQDHVRENDIVFKVV
ncbi:MAG: hypothetical protein QME62_10785 [Armatimonadota bacterium]|nr:hypothetical protein [Armatimonadota bacterium]